MIVILLLFATVAIMSALYSWANIVQFFFGHGFKSFLVFILGIVLTLLVIYSSLD